MKKKVILSMGILSAIIALAETMGTTNTTESIKKSRRNRIAEAGGFVTKIGNGRVVQIYDAKHLIPDITAQRVVQDVQNATGIAIKYTLSDLGESGAVATVKVIDSEEIGALSIQPEKFTTLLNVRELRQGVANDEQFNTRCTKQLWRALAYALGAGNSNGPYTVMKPFRSMKELDECNVCVAGPETLNVMIKAAKLIGVAEAHTMTYKQACQEGWAPQPTNDVQRAIWDKVHAMPTEPLKIKSETKKQEK